MTTPSSAPVPVSEPQAPSTAPVLSYNSEPYAAMPQYTIVSQGGEIQQGIWAQLARQGYSQENFVSAQVVDEASTDDIIQKSLAMSGISQEMIEASRTPKRDSPSALESESVESHNMNALQTVNSRSIAMRGGAPSLNKDMTNSVTPQGAELVDADQLSDQEVAVEDDTDHACDACGKSFDTVQSLLFHLREHVNNCQYECASCNALFRLSSELQKHVKTCKMAVRFRPYHCDHCDLTFYKKTAFHRHVIQHKENRTRFPCDVCQKSFASASYLKKHQESHESPKGQNEPDENGGTEIDKTSKKKVVRKECGTKNTDEVSGPKIDEVDLVSEDDEDDENGIEVGELKENRSKSRTLRKRPKQNLAEIIDPDDEEEFDMIYVAPPTSKKPPVVRAAAKPRKPRSTTPEKRIRLGKAPKMLPPVKKLLKCGKCGHGFENAEERRKHVQIHTTVLSDREHMCLVCGKTYTMGCNLERHALVHTNTRLHRCDLCGKGFHRVDILDRHRRIHTGEKPHECPICELRFISTAALLTHKKRVHADKRFSCDKCTESFLTDNLLERHKKSHNANRRFTCDKCGKSFINTSNLKTHMRIHTREKPFICDHCGERFTQKAHVERHILIHTRPKQAKDEENPPLNAEAIQQFVKQLYFCPTCNKSFPKRRGLRMHERMRHGIGKGLKVKPEMALPTEQTVHHPVVQVVQQQQVQQNPQTWYPPVIHQQQVPHQQQQQQQQPQQQHQQQRPPQQQQQQQQQQLQQQQPQQQQQQQPMQQQQIQYAVPVNQVQHCTVYNPSNGNVYTQQYLHQGLNQQFDIQIQQPLGQEDQVIFTAADSHDTIMYLIEAAASSNMINQPLQQNQIQAQMIHPDHFHQHNGEQRFGEMTTIHVQQAPQHQILQQQQIQIQQAPIQQQPQQAQQQQQQLIAVVEQPIKMPKRPKMEKNALGAKPYKCSNCGEHFASSGVLVKHMRIHTGEKPYTCTHCGKSFTQVGNLHRHVKSHQGIRNHRCNICGKSFTRRERLLYHSKLHTGEKNFKCGECGKEFGHKVNLMAHYNRRHSGYRPHGCNLCNKSFAEKRALKFHLKTHAPKSTDKDHICSECGRAFRTPERLASHSRVHSNLRPHKCTLCSKSYTLPTSLRSHYAAHHAPKLSEGMQLNCTECPKKFTTRMQLLSHQKIHSTPKYECDVCHKKFTVSSNLKNHLRVHSGEKPFKCDKCGQSFAQRGHLLRHVRPCVKKRFSCLECSASFSNLNALSRHINKSHGLPPKKRFPCDQCDLHFSSAASLQKHVQTEHPLIAYVETVDITNKATNDETEADPLSIVDSKCLSCDKTFADETELDAHVINCAFKPLTTDHRGGANRKQAVDKASTATKNLKTRNASVKKQEGKSVVAKTPGTKKDCSKPFKCATCSNCFSSIAQLRNHAKKHVGEVFKCTHCQENFTGAATLKTHLETCPSHETEIVDTGEPALLQPSDSAGVSVVPIVPDNAEIPGIVHNNPSRLSLPVPV